jgi:hypothetical protein
MNTKLPPPVSASPEDTKFLTTISRANRMSVGEVLMTAPPRLLSASIDEVNFPSRFVNRVRSENVNTLADLLRLRPDTLKGKNLGARTLEVAAEELSKFFTKKIHQAPLVTLRDMMADFASDMLAREARIWEMRMGLLGEISTLETVGSKFGLTRERVRQIEDAMFRQFVKKYPAVNLIAENVRDGMALPALVLATGELLSIMDPLPLVGILQNLDPKMYLVRDAGTDPVISTKPQTEYIQNVRRTLSIAEEIFRNSEVPLTREAVVKALSESPVDDATRVTALEKIDNEGVWVDGLLVSPNTDRTNIAIGILQSYTHPVSYAQLAEDVEELTHEEQTEEQLRSALSLVPLVKSFGYSQVGFPRMVQLPQEMVVEIISYCEGVVQRGTSGFQWNTKDLLAKAKGRFDGLTLSHHELNVLLHQSKKLAYLGRLTWVLRSEHDTERKFYRDIFMGILEKAGKPLPEETLIERAKRQRGFHPNAHLRNETELLEVAPKVWGLTRRDNPFSKAEVAKLTKAFDATFHNGKEFDNEYLAARKLDTKGIKPSEIMKIIEVHTTK